MSMAGAIRYARANVEIGADLSPLNAALLQAQAKMQAWGNQVAGIGKSMLGTGMSMVNALRPGILAFASYEQALAELRAASNPTTEQFARIKDSIEAVALATGTMPVDVTQAFSELIKAGAKVEDVLGGLGETTVKFARVSGMSLADTAVILSDAMNVFSRDRFGNQILTASQAVNIMNQAADAATISLEQVSRAFATGGAPMAEFNQNMLDTATAIAILGNAGVKAETAGTALKTFMTRLATGAGEAGEGGGAGEVGEAMEALGLDVRDAERRVVPFIEILRRLERALAGKSEAERHTLIKKLAGMRGIQAVLPLLRAGSAGFLEMQQTMQSALPVEEKFNIIMDTLIGHLKRLWVQITLIAVEIGSALAPTLSSLGQGFQRVLTSVLDFVKNNHKLVHMFTFDGLKAVAFGATLIAVGWGISAVGSMIGMAMSVASVAVSIYTGVLAAAKAVWAGAALVLGLLPAAAHLAVAAFLLLWQAIMFVSSGGGVFILFATLWTIWTYAAAAATLVWTTAVKLFNLAVAVGTAVLGLFTVAQAGASGASILGKLSAIGHAIALKLLAFAANLAAIGLAAVGVAILALPFVWLGFAVYEGIRAAGGLAAAWQAVAGPIGGALQQTAMAAQELFGRVGETVMGAFGGIMDAYSMGNWVLVWDIFKSAALLALADIAAFANQMWISWKYAIFEVFQNLSNYLEDVFISTWTRISMASNPAVTREQIEQAVRLDQQQRDRVRRGRGVDLADRTLVETELAQVREEIAGLEVGEVGRRNGGDWGEAFARRERLMGLDERARRLSIELAGIEDRLAAGTPSYAERRELELAMARAGTQQERAVLQTRLDALVARAARGAHPERELQAEYNRQLSAASDLFDFGMGEGDAEFDAAFRAMESIQQDAWEMLGVRLEGIRSSGAGAQGLPDENELNNVSRNFSSYGSFSGRAISAFGGAETAAERTARATERANELLEEQLRILRDIDEGEEGMRAE